MVRIGFLGSGFVATFYQQGLRDVPGQEVVVSYSRTEERAQQFAEEWSIPEWTTEMEAVIERDDVDLVLIALPNHLHREAALACAEAGRNMVCTKPLARNAEEAADMLQAVREAGVMHGYAETEVFSPAVMHARSLIEDGAIGDVLSVRSRESHFGPHSPHFWDPELTGGGALNDMGCHCISAALYFLEGQAVPDRCLAWGELLYHQDKTEAEDNAVLLLRFDGGEMSITETSWSAHGGLDLRNEIYGTEGTIFTDVTRRTPMVAFTTQSAGYVVEKAEADTGWVFPCVDEARVYGYHEEMRHFVECVETGRTPRQTFDDGYLVNVILDAAYRSMDSGTWEQIPLP
ncbi:MAG: Gfo/Idh/MocA family protein [Armatimonadota bacterium]